MSNAAPLNWESAVPYLAVEHTGPYSREKRWMMTPLGVSIAGKAPVGTSGAPASALRVWNWFGDDIRTAANSHQVPVELIVATILTETAGGVPDRERVVRARREEPGYLSEEDTPARISAGCMQTLLSTAASMLGHRVTAEELFEPKLSILAGTAYIARAFTKTSYDPPLVAASYNAGGIYFEGHQGNRWRMRCFPMGTGRHITKFVEWFNDAMRLGAAVSLAGEAPSFAVEFARRTV